MTGLTVAESEALKGTLMEELDRYFVGTNNPFKVKTANEIFAELEESRKLYEQGKYEDFDDAVDETGAKYGIAK